MHKFATPEDAKSKYLLGKFPVEKGMLRVNLRWH